MLVEWVREKLESVKEESRILIEDPFQVISPADPLIVDFIKKNEFIAFNASTNLILRERMREVMHDPKNKVILIDHTPTERKELNSTSRAPPLFYPDFLEKLPDNAHLQVDLRTFLKDKTGSSWPAMTNEHRYGRLILKNLPGIIEAFTNLRAIDPYRFSDDDFRRIVAYAALGIGSAAFKQLSFDNLWTICLNAHTELLEIAKLAPDVSESIRLNLKNQAKPFRWFAEHSPTEVIRGYYTALILSQHIENWAPVLKALDPPVGYFRELSTEDLQKIAPALFSRYKQKVEQDLIELEDNFSVDSLHELLFSYLKIDQPSGFQNAIKKEQISPVIRLFSLIMAISNLLSKDIDIPIQKNIYHFLFEEPGNTGFIDLRTTPELDSLVEAYRNTFKLIELKAYRKTYQKTIDAKTIENVSFNDFWTMWNDKRAGLIEYYISLLERVFSLGDDTLIGHKEILLPGKIKETLKEIREQLKRFSEIESKNDDSLNVKFQTVIKRDYPSYITQPDGPVLTSQFIRRVLLSHWDISKEKAVVIVLDGMRYDIWEELVYPALLENLEKIQEYQGCSLLPSETQLSRKALAAGTFPDEFDTGAGEDRLLQSALRRDAGYQGPMENLDSNIVGVTTSYRAGNLDWYIFEFCDNALHHIEMKTVAGQNIPKRPLYFIYQNLLRNIIEHDLMGVVKKFSPGTKVFIVTDHGFTRIGREKLFFKPEDESALIDCRFRYCMITKPITATSLPPLKQKEIITFSPEELRVPVQDKRDNYSGHKISSKPTIAFPPVGASFSKPNSHFKPDAYTHGGISMQENMIPMVVLRVRDQDSGALTANISKSPTSVEEGEEIQITVSFSYVDRTVISGDEMKVQLFAYISEKPDEPISPSITFVPLNTSKEVIFTIKIDPDEASSDERTTGIMNRRFILNYNYLEKGESVRKTISQEFSVRLNAERIVRRVGKLSTILGLSPRSSGPGMRG